MQQMQLNYETSRIQQDILTLQKYVVQCCYIPENSFIVYVYERRCSSYNFVSIHKSNIIFTDKMIMVKNLLLKNGNKS